MVRSFSLKVVIWVLIITPCESFCNFEWYKNNAHLVYSNKQGNLNSIPLSFKFSKKTSWIENHRILARVNLQMQILNNTLKRFARCIIPVSILPKTNLVKVITLKLFYYQTFFETWRNEHSWHEHYKNAIKIWGHRACLRVSRLLKWGIFTGCALKVWITFIQN